jgi:uncharacterized OB-fold protein
VTAVSPTGPDLRPVPVPDATNRFFWDAASRQELVLQRCDTCSLLQYPPDVVCVHCQSVAMTETVLSGSGTLYSYAVLERSFHPGWTEPYVVGLVELAEQRELKMLTNIVETPLDRLEVGMAVEAVFERRGEVTLPQFRAAGAPR